MNQLQFLRDQNEKLREETVTAKIEKEKEGNREKEEIEKTKMRIQEENQLLVHLRKNRNRQREEINEISTTIKLRKEKLSESQLKLSSLFHALKEKKGERNKVKMESENTSKKLSHNRRYLVSELLSFFPVNKISETECAVVSIVIVNSVVEWKEKPPEVVATAISNILQILSILGIYLNVSLPYKVDFKGSRSYIWREGSTKKYLLYNSYPPEDFQIALDMLNWNVIHLCSSQGIVINQEEHDFLVPNLLKAMKSPFLGTDDLQEEESNLSSSQLSSSHLGKFSLTASLPVSSAPEPQRQRSSTHIHPSLSTSPPSKEPENRPRSSTYSSFSLPSSLDLPPSSILPSKLNVNSNTTGSSLFGWLSNSWISSSPQEKIAPTFENTAPKNIGSDSPVILHHSSDDEEYVVIHDTIPKPEDDDQDIANFERAMFIDKVEEPKKKIREAPT